MLTNKTDAEICQEMPGRSHEEKLNTILGKFTEAIQKIDGKYASLKSKALVNTLKITKEKHENVLNPDKQAWPIHDVQLVEANKDLREIQDKVDFLLSEQFQSRRNAHDWSAYEVADENTPSSMKQNP